MGEIFEDVMLISKAESFAGRRAEFRKPHADNHNIMEKSRSKEFLDYLREWVRRVENDKWKQEILEDIRTAAEYIDE